MLYFFEKKYRLLIFHNKINTLVHNLLLTVLVLTAALQLKLYFLCLEPHSGSYDEDGINLEEIREFAKDFKIRRLSLGLTQTQVGQALTATEGPAYSQSAICR